MQKPPVRLLLPAAIDFATLKSLMKFQFSEEDGAGDSSDDGSDGVDSNVNSGF